MGIIGIATGDGVGKEIIDVVIPIIEKVAEKYKVDIGFRDLIIGGASIDRYGTSLTEYTISSAKNCDAVIVGAVGGDKNSKWYEKPINDRPEMGLLRLRKQMDLYINLRPVHFYKALADIACQEINTDFEVLLIRETASGVYFGEKNTYFDNGIINASDSLNYSEKEIERTAKRSIEMAKSKNSSLLCVDMAHILETSRLWRMVLSALSYDTEVFIKYMHADKCAEKLIKSPSEFSIILTDNLLGDMLFGVLAGIQGSAAMIPSAYLGDTNFGIYESCGGPAIDIEGKDIANPLGNILSAGLMFEHSFNNKAASKCIKKAVSKVLAEGYRTMDMMKGEGIPVGTSKMGDLILKNIE